MGGICPQGYWHHTYAETFTISEGCTFEDVAQQCGHYAGEPRGITLNLQSPSLFVHIIVVVFVTASTDNGRGFVNVIFVFLKMDIHYFGTLFDLV